MRMQMHEESICKIFAENTTDLMSIIDCKGILRYASTSHEYILGNPPQYYVGKSVFEFMLGEDLSNVKDFFQDVVKFGKSGTIQVKYLHKDGHNVHLESNLKAIVEENGEIKNVISVSRDVTKRIKTEAALVEAEARYRSLVEDSLVGVYITQDGILQYVNPRFAEIYGYEQEEIIGTEVLSYIIPEQRQYVADIIQNRLKGKSISPFHAQIRRRDGQIIDLEIHGALTIYNGKQATTGTVLDISERIKAEERIRRSEKLAVVGELAAGIGHEIRNPLAAIRGFIQILDLEKPKNKEYKQFILYEIDRMNTIVSELMYLAKPQATNFEKHSVHKILHEVITLLGPYAMLHNVQIVTKFDFSPYQLLCDKNQIKQVFVNVIKNAVESMLERGVILISLTEKKDSLRIKIKDNGCGIPKDKIPKLGDPFNSKKKTGRGLALMTCFKIMDHHNGKMKITSKVGKGTTVEMIFKEDTMPTIAT